MHTRPCCPAFALGLALSTLAGCQSYQPKPLDHAQHLDAFESRSVEAEPLRDFIESLDQRDHPKPFDPSDGIDIHEGERIALFYNPDLRLSRIRVGVEHAIAEHAGRWDDPKFDIEALRITDSVPDRWIVSSSLSITLPISGRLGAERQRAEASVRAALSRIAETEWATRALLRRAWLEWSATELQINRAESLMGSISTLVDSTDRLARAGELPSTQASLFAIERANLAQMIQRLSSTAIEQELQLRALMGFSPDAPLRLNPTLALPDALSIPETDTLVENHPTLVRMRDEHAIAEKTLLREIRKQYPDLTIGPIYESEEGVSRIGLLAGIPLPILNANTQGIAQARAERELTRATYETQLERVMHELAASIKNLEAARAQRVRYESEIVPLIDRQLRDAQRLLELGENDGIVLLESLTRAGQAYTELINARLNEALAIDRLRTIIDTPRVSTEITTNAPDMEVHP